MKRRAEFLVEKRDGRREWLRAEKLARSIHLALTAVGAGESWRAVDLADAVLNGVRKRSLARGDAQALRTIELADAVQQVLIATGYPGAAWAFTQVGAERRQRSVLLALERAPMDAAIPTQLGRPPAPASAPWQGSPDDGLSEPGAFPRF